MSAPLPPDERRRLETLCSMKILDTPPESRFDELAKAAAEACDTPVALVSLMDEDRQWFKAKVGLEVDQTPRVLAFCGYTLLEDDLLVVEDARADARFSSNPLVLGEPHIRFYAGMPLIDSAGTKLGTLCVIDDRPRALEPEQARALRALAWRVVEQLERSLPHAVPTQPTQAATDEAAANHCRVPPAVDGPADSPRSGIKPHRGAMFAALVTTVLYVVALTATLTAMSRSSHQAQGDLLRIAELTGQITHLDEVLTMSSRMAAATADPAWEARYHRYEPELDKAIKALIARAPAVYDEQGGPQTDAANLALVAMETRAFDLVRAGDRQGAWRLLTSEEYERQKRRYAGGMQRTQAAMATKAHAEAAVIQHRLLLLTTASAAGLALLGVLWWRVSRRVKRYAEGHQSLADSAQRAREAAERTADEVRLLSLVAAHTDNAVIITDALGHVEWVNDGFERISGYTLDDVRGRKPGALLQGPHTDPQTVAFMRTALAAGEAFKVEVLNYHKNGTAYWLRLDVQPVCDEAGQIVRFVAIELDITDTKRREEELRRSAALLEAQQEASIDGILVVDEAGRVAHCNGRFAEIWDIPCEVLERRDDEALLAHVTDQVADPDAFVARVRHLYAHPDETGRDEVALRDGRTLDRYSAPVRSATGESLGRIWYFRDVTEARRAEEAIRAAKMRFERMAANVPGLVYQFELGSDGSASFPFVSDGVREVYGVEPAEAMADASVLLDAVEPEHREGFQASIMRSAQDLSPWEWDGPFRHRDGSVRQVHCRSRPERLADGTVLWDGIVTDITALKQAQAELADSEARVRAILDAELDALVTMDARGCVTGWNRQATQLFGYDESEALGAMLSQLVIPEHLRDAHQAGLRHYLRTGEGAVLNRRIEVPAMRKGGEVFAAELAVAPLHTSDEVSFVAFLRDINHRKQAEEQLRESKRLAEEANRAKSEFLANMSHEIRTPLGAVIGFGELLENDPETEVSDRRDWARTIRTAGQHLLALVNDVLDLSKIEAGRMEYERLDFDPARVLSEVASTMRVAAAGKGLDLELEYQGPMPVTLHTDPTRLKQVVVNLVNNAIKFTATGGVRIVAGMEGREDGAGGERLRVSVVDTGVGVPADKQEAIFNAFEQADSSVTRKFGGTGLGLTISRRIVRDLGGDLSMVSTPGEGSTFTLSVDAGQTTWPAAGRENHAPSEAIAAGSASTASPERPDHDAGDDAMKDAAKDAADQRRRVLLVDDGEANRKLVALLLKRAGYEVATACNGREGADAALAEEFDVMLLDMQMPVMDGYSAATFLRERGYDRPIIALTAHAMKGDRDKCVDAGCDDYLTKPIDTAALLETVARAIRCGRLATATPPARAIAQPLMSSLLMGEDDAELAEIVDSFVEHLHGQTRAMRQALDEGEMQALAELAHWLKGSGGTMGFDAFTAPAAALEAAARTGALDEVRSKLDDILTLARRVPTAAATAPPLAV